VILFRGICGNPHMIRFSQSIASKGFSAENNITHPGVRSGRSQGEVE